MEGSGISWQFWLSFPSLGTGQTVPHQKQIPRCVNVLILMPHSPADALSCIRRLLSPKEMWQRRAKEYGGDRGEKMGCGFTGALGL